MSKTVSVIGVRCCGIVCLLSCGKRELSPPSNPAAVISFRSMNVNPQHIARHSWKAGTFDYYHDIITRAP